MMLVVLQMARLVVGIIFIVLKTTDPVMQTIHPA
jgi:hypothetical protein